MKVTLADVAEIAGTSPSTVSRALSSPEMVNIETARRIHQIAAELGYRPRRPQNHSHRRTGVIALIIPDISNPFFPPIAKAVQARAATHGLTAVVSEMEEYAMHELSRATKLVEKVDGFIIASPRTENVELERLGHDVPTVLINREVSGMSSVSIEDSIAMYEAVE